MKFKAQGKIKPKGRCWGGGEAPPTRTMAERVGTPKSTKQGPKNSRMCKGKKEPERGTNKNVRSPPYVSFVLGGVSAGLVQNGVSQSHSKMSIVPPRAPKMTPKWNPKWSQGNNGRPLRHLHRHRQIAWPPLGKLHSNSFFNDPKHITQK